VFRANAAMSEGGGLGGSALPCHNGDMIDVLRLPVLSDNYIWLMHDRVTLDTVVIDPAVADPVLDKVRELGWQISEIWNTHWHPDHVGGNAGIVAATGCPVTGPADEAAKIPHLTRAVREGEKLDFGGATFRVIDVRAHTSGHIAYYSESEAVLFCGDSLFAMGCGRLFEGTAAQGYASMEKLRALPDDVTVYCAHEYTASNGRFALTVEPDNAALVDRMEEVTRARAADMATVPFFMGEEKKTNPFLRAASVAEFAGRRLAKDSFRG
jgi:hydroxyacylglutathione hydrolase